MEIRHKLWMLIAILFSMVTLSGCGNSERVHESWVVPPEGQQYDDNAILNNIKARLSDHADIKNLPLNIDVKNGEVSLNGLVDNQAQADKVVMQTWLVEGVKKVNNQLRTKDSPSTANQ
ncbi:BON domain-containing protein [Nitrosomonas communis]|uniref:Hyperosmotically inducible protein n=1 Tax=Nitrosomonas communis TaxID=44574 RepID=A0A1H2SUA9_9PROT|nr:BON domain-containing protein [Nitrosomonas communis]SDW34624.1 hyperosmotically inducible protein [Nitrosomonas communis]